MKRKNPNIEYRNTKPIPENSEDSVKQNFRLSDYLKIRNTDLLSYLSVLKSLCSAFRVNSNAGFTLIELLVVISIMAVLSIISIASFSAFGNSQKLNAAALDLKNTLQQAKSQSFTQVDTCGAQQFNGYEVKICCANASCNSCSSLNPSTSDGYELDIVCGGTPSAVNGKKLPQGVTINTTVGQTTTYTVMFNSLSNSVTGNGQVVIKQGSALKTILVNPIGTIQ